MRKMLKALLCNLIALGFVSGAYGLTIPASEDTVGYLNKLTTGANVAPNLMVDATHTAFLYFNLDEVPHDAVLRWAKLRLFLPSVRVKGAGLGVHVVNSQWDEAAASNQPAVGATRVATIEPEKLGTRRFVTVDVTSTVQSWISGGTMNEGFAIKPISGGSAVSSLYLTSKDGASLGLPAELDIELKPEAEAPAPVTVEQLPSPLKPLLSSGLFALNDLSQLPPALRSFLTPSITVQPSLLSTGGSLTVQAQGLGSLSYQWMRNGLPISTGTESSLRRAGLAGGTYQVRASNTVSGTNSASVVIPDNGHEVVFVPNTGVMFSKYETTVGQWKAFVEATGWSKSDAWKTPANEGQSDWVQDDSHPVVKVSWKDAKDYCAWLSAKTGKIWRLPTDLEWVTLVTTLYPWGNNFPPDSTTGNFAMNAGGSYDWPNGGVDGFKWTAPVGSFKSNSVGLYDVGGNVWEWMDDTEVEGNDLVRLIRGSSWNEAGSDGDGVISSHRVVLNDYFLNNNIGFRVVCEPSIVAVAGGVLPSGSALSGQVVSDFQIGKTEVTWGEWKTVREWAVSDGYSDLAGVGAGVGDDYPVTDVSWYDVVKWCNAKSEREGKTPVYQVNGVPYKTGQSEPTVGASANGYRLPTEAEWEWAARGGRQTKGYTYSGSNDSDAVGWFIGNSGYATHAVGTKAANELGVSDMSGNVCEWCAGWLPGSEGVVRVRRGGDWLGSAGNCAVASRNNDVPVSRQSYNGFRVAISSSQ